MLSWLFRRNPKPVRRVARTARLRLEALEDRYCLSPWIILYENTQPGHQLFLAGQVQDSNPAGDTVTFSGAATGTAAPDVNGNYSFSCTNATLGTVYAVATGPDGVSNTAQDIILDAGPTLTLSISNGAQRTVTLSGQVSGMDQAGLTVTFSGVVSGSTVTTSSGSFSYTAQASGLGSVQASTVDSWGVVSKTAQVQVGATPPNITNFNCSEGGNELWTFSGTVSAQNPQGLQVVLSGLTVVNGKTALVQSNGYFSVSIQLGLSDDGAVYAQCTDCWGQQSNLAATTVSQA